MRRIFALLFVLSVCFGLVACGEAPEGSASQPAQTEPQATDAPALPEDAPAKLVLSGIAADTIQYYQCAQSGNFAVIAKDGKYGLIGYDGKMVLPMECETLYRGGGLAYDSLWALKEGKSYRIDANGQLVPEEAPDGDVLPEVYWYEEKAVSFVLGEGHVDFDPKQTAPVVNQRTWQEHAVLPLQQLAEVIEEPWGLMPVVKDKNYGLLDVDSGAMASEFVYEKFDTLNGFSDGLLALKKDGKWGYVDVKGEVVIDFLHEPYEADAFGNNEQLNPAINGYVAICRDGKWGLVTVAGEVVLETAYDGISQVNPDGMFWAKAGNTWSLYQLTV